MKSLFKFIHQQSFENQLLDIASDLIKNIDCTSAQRVETSDGEMFIADGVGITLDRFTDGGIAEVTMSFDYKTGSGLLIILRNYLHHSVIINHAIGGTFHTIEFKIPPDSIVLRHYRKLMDSALVTIEGHCV